MFERTIALIGTDNVEKLHLKKVLVLGVGGVGSYAVEALVRAGIGTIIIIDADYVALSNLNRQLMTNQNNIGLSKVDVLEERIKSINPDCHVIKIKEFKTTDNLNLLFNLEPDYIIDFIDTIKTKKYLLKEC